jgi:hypothetical protein
MLTVGWVLKTEIMNNRHSVPLSRLFSGIAYRKCRQVLTPTGRLYLLYPLNFL